MKSIVLLFLMVSYTTHLSFAQSYADILGADQILAFSEKIATWTQQADLQTNHHLVIDSIQTAIWQTDSEIWQPQQRKYFYYSDAVKLDKDLTFNYLTAENTWQAQQNTTYTYHDSGFLDYYTQAKLKQGEWLPFQQVWMQYNNENVLRKEKYLLWEEDNQMWKDEEVTNLDYYSNGQLLGITTASLQGIPPTWEVKNYRTFVYKSEEGWLDEEQLLRWDVATQRMYQEHRLVAHYSENILKEVLHFVWNESEQAWESIGKMVLFYHETAQLERISFQGAGETDNNWEEVAQCDFSWLQTPVSVNEEVEVSPIQVYCT